MVACAAKSLNKGNLLVGERLHLFAAYTNYPDYRVIFEQRNKQGRPMTCLRRRDPKIIPMIAFKCCQVWDVGG